MFAFRYGRCLVNYARLLPSCRSHFGALTPISIAKPYKSWMMLQASWRVDHPHHKANQLAR